MAKSLKHATFVNYFKGRAKLADVLDNAEQKMIAQGKGSVNAVGQCVYFNDDGCSCAVGLLLPKDSKGVILEKKVNVNGVTLLLHYVGGVLGLDPDRIETFQYEKLEAIKNLQTVHDNIARQGYTGTEWVKRVKEGMAEYREQHAAIIAKY